MDFHVYYRAWPHKNLRQIAVTDAEDWQDAVTQVTGMLKHEKEKHFKPLIAVVVGGKI